MTAVKESLGAGVLDQNHLMMWQNEDWKQMFGAAPIERSTMSSSQKSKSPSPAGSVTAVRSEKELSQLSLIGSSMEHLALTRSGSTEQLGTSSTVTVSSGGVSPLLASVTRSMRQPLENSQRGHTNIILLLFSCLTLQTSTYVKVNKLLISLILFSK